MAISHELTSEIASALFTAQERSPRELNDLKEMLLEIHSTLERLTEKRRDRQTKIDVKSPPLTKAFRSSI